MTQHKSFKAWKTACSIAYVGTILSVVYIVTAPTPVEKIVAGIIVIIMALLVVGAHKKMSRVCMSILLLLYVSNLILSIQDLGSMDGSPFILFIITLFIYKGTLSLFRLHKAGITTVKDIPPNQELVPTRTTPSEEVNF